MKKYFFLIVLTILFLLSACSNSSDSSTSTEESNKDSLTIYTTVYPLQYFAEQIGGDFVEVSSIYPPGSNEHTFEPTQKDMIQLAEADLFFYIGLGLESFVQSAEKSLAKENVKFVSVTEYIHEEKFHVSVGHSHDDHHHHEEDDYHGEDEHHHHGEVDPHVWLSPDLSKDLALAIKNELVKFMPEHEQTFNDNYETLVKRLDELDEKFQTLANEASNKVFFVSHASFGYIAGQYGLTQIPVAGLNSQSEPSQKELTEIVKLAKEYKVGYILFEQNVSSKLTSIIQEEIGAEPLLLHNLSVLTEEDIEANEDYFTLMEKNIDIFKTALN